MAKVYKSIASILTPNRIVYYQTHPVEFVQDYILCDEWVENGGTKDVSEHQKELLNAIANHRRVAAKSGHGIGKTAVLSWAAIWWLACFGNARVVATAPSLPQLKSVLWPELALWLNRSLLKEYFELTATRLYLIENRENSFAELRTASKEESLQGIHATNLLLMIDEASGVDDSIHIMLQGALTKPNNRIVQVSNPIRTSGYFYDAFHRFKHWSLHTFNSEDSPNVSREYINDMALRWGRTHTIYRVRVLGEFPSGDPDSFIALEDVQAAVIRGQNRTDELSGVPEIGVDVARKGDDLTTICSRVGNVVLPLVTKEKTSVPEVASMVLVEVQSLRNLTGYSDIIRVKVDDTGVGGGVTDLLELDRANNIEVVPVSFGGAGNENYENEASIMWGNFRDMLPNICLPNDEVAVEELAARRWSMSLRSKIMIESKKDFKKSFKKSPDHADGIILAFAKKKNERKLLKGFDPIGSEIIAEAPVSGDLYCSIFYNNGFTTSVVWCRWNGSQLAIIGEHVGSDGDAVTMIRNFGPYRKVVGNSVMFSKGNNDLYEMYSRSGIYVTENYQYDEFGAIQKLDQMTREKSVLVLRDCGETIAQLRSWSLMSGGRKVKQDEFGLCYALLHLMSDLRPMSQSIMRSVPTTYYAPKPPMHQDANEVFMSL